MGVDGTPRGAPRFPPPLGVDGERLQAPLRALAAWGRDAGQTGGETNPSTAVYEESQSNETDPVRGRNMFGGGPGPWDEIWTGWRTGPPFHIPVYVLTHRPRQTLELGGGTRCSDVTEGIGSALGLAERAARVWDVGVAGGGTMARQFLEAGLVDERELCLVPALLGDGVRLFHGGHLPPTEMDLVWVGEAPGVAHRRYRLGPASRDRELRPT